MNEPACVYLMSVGKLHKIGCASNPQARAWQIRWRYKPLKVELVHFYGADDARDLESRIHWHFRDKHVEDELFNLDAADVATFSRFERRQPRKPPGRLLYDGRISRHIGIPATEQIGRKATFRS